LGSFLRFYGAGVWVILKSLLPFARTGQMDQLSEKGVMDRLAQNNRTEADLDEAAEAAADLSSGGHWKE
jgi:hypothetical protein